MLLAEVMGNHLPELHGTWGVDDGTLVSATSLQWGGRLQVGGEGNAGHSSVLTE